MNVRGIFIFAICKLICVIQLKSLFLHNKYIHHMQFNKYINHYIIVLLKSLCFYFKDATGLALKRKGLNYALQVRWMFLDQPGYMWPSQGLGETSSLVMLQERVSAAFGQFYELSFISSLDRDVFSYQLLPDLPTTFCSHVQESKEHKTLKSICMK